MPLLQMLATAQEEQSLGHLQDLSSPVLGKLKEALIFTRLAAAQRRAFGSRTVVLDGLLGCQLHLGWFEDARLLVMAYKNPACKDEPGKAHFTPQATMVTPDWLKAVAPAAAINSNVLNVFESLKDEDHCLAQVMQSITGGVTPRRITSVGYCVGGSVASLAAIFAALQCPTADVRCITFGSQLVGNAAFADAFRWLVGLSYRVVYRRDPVPSHKHRRLNLLNDALTHVHGEIYIDDEQLTPGKQPAHSLKDAEDHSLMRYAEAMHKICLAHFERDLAAGGNMYSKFARCYLQLAGKEPSQLKKEPLHAAAAAAAAADTGQGHQAKGSGGDPSGGAVPNSPGVVNSNSPLAEGRSPEGPFDFSSPVQSGRPVVPQAQQSNQQGSAQVPQHGNAPFWNQGPLPGERDTHAQTDPAADSQEDKERQLRCGRALLERAMLGPPLPEGDAPICSSEAAESNSIKTVQDPAYAGASSIPSGPATTENTALTAAIKSDLETDKQATGQSLSAVAAANVYPSNWSQEYTGAPGSSGLGKAQSADHSTIAAESISPRYSSQQSQGTNIDWEAADAGEVSSRSLQPESAAVKPQQQQQQQQQGTAPTGQSGDIEQHIAGMHSDQFHQLMGKTYQNQSSDKPNEQFVQPSLAQESMSVSGQQATAICNDVRGMAPNPGSSMLGEEGGGRPWLKRAFSMVDKENMGIDMTSKMDSIDKVLVTGKISQAVVVAAAAYRTEAEFRERTGIQQSKLIVDEFHTNTHVHVGWLEGGTAILAFRGTQTAQDGLQDVKIVRQSIDHLQGMFPGTQAHSGFLQQFAGVCRPDVPEKNMATVLEQLSGGKAPSRVLCCGHSLGGALATLGATWAALQYPQADIRCITFGSPRVGNKSFKRAFHTLVGTSLRLVHGGDPVPVLPPAFVYHHVNGAIHIMGGKIKLRSRPWHFKLRPNVADHLVARYNAGIYMHMPGGIEEMPLPRPRNLRRLSSVAGPVNGRTSKGRAMDRLSSGQTLDNASPTAAAAAAMDADDGVPQLGSSITPYGAYGAVYNNAVQEAQDVADALHLRKRSEDRQRSEGLFGSFRRSKKGSGESGGNNAGWTMWHMFGCVAMQKGVRDESSSSDEDDSVPPVHTRHSRQSLPSASAN